MFAVAALLLAVAAAEAGVPEASTAAAHVEDCIAATHGGTVDLTLIESRGWTSMNMRSSDGKPLPTVAYSRRDDMSFLSASTAAAESVQCVVLIPTHGRARADALRDTLSVRLGSKPTGTVTGQAAWSAEGHRIVAKPMGNAADPSGLNIEVTVEKK